jgi:hypothetical protein
MSNEVEAAWNDLPDALKAHPGIKRLNQAARAAVLAEREAWRIEVESCLRAAGITEGMAREIAAAIRNPSLPDSHNGCG